MREKKQSRKCDYNFKVKVESLKLQNEKAMFSGFTIYDL